MAVLILKPCRVLRRGDGCVSRGRMQGAGAEGKGSRLGGGCSCSLVAMAVLLLAGLSCSSGDVVDGAPGQSGEGERLTVLVGETLFELEVALTPKARERGLMLRDTLAPEAGMLFVFPEDRPLGFWMKNTLIDLDIAYLDARGRVVSWAEMVAEEPRQEHETEEQYEDRLKLYPSEGEARFAVEFRSGTLTLLKLRVGDALPLPVEHLLSRAR